MITGHIVIEPGVDLQDALAEVRLRDMPLADAPARTVARVTLPCSGVGVHRLPYELHARVHRGRDYALAAEVRRAGGERLQPGDLLTVEGRRWRLGEPAAELRVVPIS